MPSFESRWRGVFGWLAVGAGLALCAAVADAQQTPAGFNVERFYPSAPGAGWFVMDDLSMSGGLGGAISLVNSYARNPIVIAGPGPRLALVSDQVTLDLGAAVTYDRYRVYLNIPLALLNSGNSGIIGPYQFSAPVVNPGTTPDTVSDPQLGFDVRLIGQPGSALRLGASAQLIFPSGSRADYTTDARYGGMVRLLAAGDAGRYSYAGQLGVYLRPLNEFPVPDFPRGNEFLFGVAGGRRFSVHPRWDVVIGPEFYGETATNAFFSGPTGMEGLLTGRLEETGAGPRLRFKLGIGHGLIQNFGAPQWRIVFGAEVFGQRHSH